MFLVSEAHVHRLSGDIYRRLFPLVDGRRTADEIAHALSASFPATKVYYALYQLEDASYLVEHDPRTPTAERAFWLEQGVGADQLQPRRAPMVQVVRVQALDEQNRDDLIQYLAGLGIESGGENVPLVVLTDHYLNPELAALNAQALGQARPWLIVKPLGGELWLGPVFQPGKTACWTCLQEVFRLRRFVYTHIELAQGYDTALYVPGGAVTSSVQAALRLASLQIAHWLRWDSPLAQLVTFDLRALVSEHHPVNRRERCPACGSSAAPRFPAPVDLKSSPKHAGQRSQDPEAFARQYQRFTSRLTGISAFFPDPDPLSDSLNVVWCDQNFSRMWGDLNVTRRGLRQKSGGKGATRAHAYASALGESLERYSGKWQGGEYVEYATFAELGETAIHPNALMLFSEEQYQRRDEDVYSTAYVPERFDENARVAWTPVWSLTRRTFRYVLSAYCYYHAPLAGNHYARADSNGCAAGATLEEAISQGFLELVERDCVALWWYNRARRPGVDLSSFGDAFIEQMQTFYARQGRNLWALDLTNDFGIPTFAAVSGRGDAEILLGFGAHFDARIAATRAIGEVNQMFLAARNLQRDGWQDESSAAAKWLKHATLEQNPYLVPLRQTLSRADFRGEARGDTLDDARYCERLVDERGLELLVLDQTRPDIGLPVARVMVPGLRHFWRRLAPGRLYDVPVHLGWQHTPTAEHELNPIPMFI